MELAIFPDSAEQIAESNRRKTNQATRQQPLSILCSRNLSSMIQVGEFGSTKGIAEKGK
jgi:hypothetical protein